MNGRFEAMKMRTLLTALAILVLSSSGWPASAWAGQGVRSIVRVAQAKRAERAANGSALERFRRMTPRQRQKALENLTPERRRAIQQRLRELDKLSPEQQRRLRQEYQMFRELPADRQARARRLYRMLNQFPAARRTEVSREFRRLRRLSPTERTSRLESEQFSHLYSSDEQRLLREMVKILPPRESGQ